MLHDFERAAGFAEYEKRKGALMPIEFPPRTEADWLQYTSDFSAALTADFADFDMVSGDATAYASAQADYAAKYAAASNPTTSGKSATFAKRQSLVNLKALTRKWVNQIQGLASVSNQQRIDLGLPIRDTVRTPNKAPPDAPVMTAVSVVGRRVKYRIKNALTPDRRAKPKQADGATVLAFIGTTPPPAGDAGWVLKGQTSTSVFEIEYPSDVEPGQAVWTTAYWYTRRGQQSPACSPIFTYLQIGSMSGTES